MKRPAAGVEMVDACVVGGGPAGAVVASRMAMLGSSVVLVERSRFPRAHLGESLSPGVLPLVATVGARGAVEDAGFRPVRSVLSNWEGVLNERVDAREEGLLVDRGRFDALLLDHARSLGVRVLQPATVVRRSHDNGEWSVAVLHDGGQSEFRARLLVDATGRSAALRGRRRRTGPRTMALYAYWKGARLPELPRIEAGAAAWFWGVPLPDATYNALVFVAANSLKDNSHTGLRSRYLSLMAESGLLAGCEGAEMVGIVRAADATPYLDEESVSRFSVKVGDAAVAIDPLSSSGVQKAIQNALSGAIVANTLLRKPELAEAAVQFHQDSLAYASARHCGWAASHYGAVSSRNPDRFWTERCAGAIAPPDVPTHAIGARIASNEQVTLSPDLEIVRVPRLGAEFVGLGSALRHPALDAPVAYLGGWELAPLLRDIRGGMTPLQVVHSWSARVPFKSGIAIAGWLLGHDILVPHHGVQR